jgi:hypothetical protein
MKWNIAHIFVYFVDFATVRVMHYFLTKMHFGYILGDFFTNSSGHPGGEFMASFQRKRAAAEIDYETFFLINLEHKKFQHHQLCNQVWENLATHCFKSAESTNKSLRNKNSVVRNVSMSNSKLLTFRVSKLTDNYLPHPNRPLHTDYVSTHHRYCIIAFFFFYGSPAGTG